MKEADPLPLLPVVCAFERTSFPLDYATTEASDTQSAEAAAAKPSRPAKYLKAEVILHVASDCNRWRMIRELSKGEPLAVRQLSRLLNISPGLASKHIAILRKSGVITKVGGKDARHRYHILSPDFPPKIEGDERVLDFGSCVLRFPVE